AAARFAEDRGRELRQAEHDDGADGRPRARGQAVDGRHLRDDEGGERADEALEHQPRSWTNGQLKGGGRPTRSAPASVTRCATHQVARRRGRGPTYSQASVARQYSVTLRRASPAISFTSRAASANVAAANHVPRASRTYQVGSVIGVASLA